MSLHAWTRVEYDTCPKAGLQVERYARTGLNTLSIINTFSPIAHIHIEAASLYPDFSQNKQKQR